MFGVMHGAIPRDAIRLAVAAGGAAGAITVNGTKSRDTLVSVLAFDFTAGSITDLTSEFSIGDNQIDNTGGTNTTGKTLVVAYLSVG